MTFTTTQSRTFTITEARYVTSKIAADLDTLRVQYGMPSAIDVTEYAEEAAILLAKRYLKSVEYGFKRDGLIVFSLRYEAQANGTLYTDDRPGKIPYGLNMTGTNFYTHLRYTDAYFALSELQQLVVKSSLPFQRATGGEPPLSPKGLWESTRTYSKNGEGVERLTFKS